MMDFTSGFFKSTADIRVKNLCFDQEKKYYFF